MKSELLSHNQNYINRWVVSYADFITMLLALFIVLYALSQLDNNHMKTFSSSMNRIFAGNTTNTNLYEKQKLLELFKSTKTNVYIDDKNLITSAESKLLKEKFASFGTMIDIESSDFENIKKNIKNEFNNLNTVKVIREPRGLLIRLNDTVLFDKGSDIINDKALDILGKIAALLENESYSIKIEGHTDNSPIQTGRFPSNWELSTARATNIIKYFVNTKRISPARLSAVGYGEYMPISDNQTETGRAQNRRVDIVVLSSSSKVFEPVNIENKQQLER